MFQPASVSLSGPAFSFLLYETCKNCVTQNGFLLGEIIHKEITSITDNEQKQVDISKIIKINSVVPCSTNSYFAKGRIDKEKLRKFLGSNFSKVVAWYKYEPFSSLKFTLKDRALHKQFKEFFDVPPDLFSFCSVSMECTDNFASYNYQQTFMRYSNGYFDRLNMYIPNLSELNNTYKNSEPASEVFDIILSTIKMNIENTKGVVAVTEIENAVQKYINDTVLDLAKAEAVLFDLEEEVKRLRKKQQENVTVKQTVEIPRESCEDNTSLDEEQQSETQKSSNIDKSENSPKLLRKNTQKSSTKPVKKADSASDIQKTEDSDSNKKEELVQENIQSSPETRRKASTPKSRGRGRSKKKI